MATNENQETNTMPIEISPKKFLHINPRVDVDQQKNYPSVTKAIWGICMGVQGYVWHSS